MIFRRLAFFLAWSAVLSVGQAQEVEGPAAGNVPPRMRVLDNEATFQIGDRLTYQVQEEREEPETLFVDGQGDVKFPLIGRLSAVGRTPFELAVQMKFLLEQDYFYHATVIIEMVQDTSTRGRVNLIGEVRTNGMQPLPADAAIRLSEMILRSGGFTNEADQTEVKLVRQGGRGLSGETLEAGTYVYNVERMLETGNFEDDPYLINNDLILVPKLDDVGGEYLVIGAVNREGAYPIDQEGLTVSRAILSAGGFSRFAQDRRVRLIRTHNETGKQETFTINVKAILEGNDLGEDRKIEDGDIIRVDEKMINL